jgi:hypothetical protein
MPATPVMIHAKEFLIRIQTFAMVVISQYTTAISKTSLLPMALKFYVIVANSLTQFNLCCIHLLAV